MIRESLNSSAEGVVGKLSFMNYLVRLPPFGSLVG
jgi:hypothetical protein